MHFHEYLKDYLRLYWMLSTYLHYIAFGSPLLLCQYEWNNCQYSGTWPHILLLKVNFPILKIVLSYFLLEGIFLFFVIFVWGGVVSWVVSFARYCREDFSGNFWYWTWYAASTDSNHPYFHCFPNVRRKFHSDRFFPKNWHLIEEPTAWMIPWRL